MYGSPTPERGRQQVRGPRPKSSRQFPGWTPTASAVQNHDVNLRGGIARSLLVAFLAAACGGLPPDEARTRQDYCFWFDRFLDVLEQDDFTEEEFDRAAEDLIAAGISFGIRGNAPGIEQSIDEFVEALDDRDVAATDRFINNTLGYCEDLLNPI